MDKGFLPVFSVDTEEEAQQLIVLTCSRSNDGQYYSEMLAQEQSLERLYAFGEKLKKAHDEVFVPRGLCKCSPTPPVAPKPKRRGKSG